MILLNTLLIITAYFLGSVCSAILICRVLRLPDPRTQGSGNPGATNVLRFGGKKAAALTLVSDAGKGLLLVALARLLGSSDLACALIGLSAFLGHLYPIFFEFKGGKGVATALGVMMGLSPLLGAMVTITWLVVFALFRYSSLAALMTTALAPIYSLILGYSGAFLPTLVMSGFLVWRHRSNMVRLLSGVEPKAY